MRPIVSILLGSGFSIPAGLPGVNELNQRLSKIDESEILIHSDQTAIFLNGQNDPNRFIRKDERLFLQEFLEFYNSKILKDGELFHYETFYDFYALYLFDGKNKEEIEAFHRDFGNKHMKGNDIISCYNRVREFDRSFNQLLASQLHNPRYLEDIGLGNYPPYDDFWRFLYWLTEKYDVKVHSLNHDLFFEYVVSQLSGLFQHFSDGFQIEGSPYYGNLYHTFNIGTQQEIQKSYYVKLAHFTDTYDTALCYYKLHGSIFNTIVYSIERGMAQKPVRIRNNYGISRYLMEQLDATTGKFSFTGVHDEVSPDFLSGTTNKMRYYTKDAYYMKLMEHFKDNLMTSDVLVVIGYGFQDEGINSNLENQFLSAGKKMYVIDPVKPKTELLDKYGAVLIEKGITEVRFDEIRNIIQIP